jgi:hypothetical protein
MTANKLITLTTVLGIPDPFWTLLGYRFSALEAFCLLCARFRSSSDQYDLAMRYDRSQSSISQVVNGLAIWIDEEWQHLLDFDYEHLLSRENLARYAKALQRAGVPQVLIWAFIDCTIRQMCKPSFWQHQAYNGHKKFHALKFQALSLPNSIVAHLFGPEEGQRNDNYLAWKSGIWEKCRQHAIRIGADENTPIGEHYYHVFRDPTYGLSPALLSPFTSPSVEQREWNGLMSSVCISVEHTFGIVQQTWPFLNAHWKLKVFRSPIGTYYHVGILLTNAINCFRPNQTAQRYDCAPPSVFNYFHH